MTPLYKGVDISYANGSVNINVLKELGYDFVIIRCGYGSDLKDQDDEWFRKNVTKCNEAGMPYGVYLYSYAKNVKMAKSEAAHALRLIKGTKPLFGVWYDLEDKVQPKNKKKLTDIAVTFCDALEAEGYYTGVYATKDWFTNRFDERIHAYDKWVAQWNKECTYSGSYGMWQYTSSEYIKGKRFDANYCYRDYPDIVKAMSDTESTAPAAPKKTLAEVVAEVLKGKYGNGNARKKKLKAEGFEPSEVQNEVNKKMKLYTATAKEVLKGKYGNGEPRKEQLRKEGFEDYEIEIIQEIVNDSI